MDINERKELSKKYDSIYFLQVKFKLPICVDTIKVSPNYLVVAECMLIYKCIYHLRGRGVRVADF